MPVKMKAGLQSKKTAAARAAKTTPAGSEKVDPGRIWVESVNDRTVVRSGQAITPEQVLGWILAAEGGDTRYLNAFYDEMRARDGHLDGEFSKATDYLTGARLDILPYPPDARGAKGSKTRAGRRASDIAKYTEEQLFSPSVRLDRAIGCLAEGLWRGASGFEVDAVAGRATGGRERLKSLTPIFPQRLRYRPQTTTLALQVTGDASYLVDVDTLGPRIVTLVAEPHVANPARRGVLRRCIGPYMIRAFGPQWWVRFVELFGMPFRLGKYAAGDAEMERRITAALRNAGNAAWAALPEGASIEFVQSYSSATSTSPHEFLLDWAAREISKVVLGATQGTDVQRNTGSRASAQVHHDVTIARSFARGVEIAGAIREQLIAPMIERNFSKDDAALYTPEFRIRVENKPDMYNVAQSMHMLVNSGMETIPVSYVHDLLSIPVPDGDEPCLAMPMVPGDPRSMGAESDAGVDGEPSEPGTQPRIKPEQPPARGTSAPSIKRTAATVGRK